MRLIHEGMEVTDEFEFFTLCALSLDRCLTCRAFTIAVETEGGVDYI